MEDNGPIREAPAYLTAKALKVEVVEQMHLHFRKSSWKRFHVKLDLTKATVKCTPARAWNETLWFAAALMFYPDEVRKGIVRHELVHTLYSIRGHGKDFQDRRLLANAAKYYSIRIQKLATKAWKKWLSTQNVASLPSGTIAWDPELKKWV